MPVTEHDDTRLVIIGAGGFGREVFDILAAKGSSSVAAFAGFVDDGSVDERLLEAQGSRLLGGTACLQDLAGHRYLVAVGSPDVRRKLAGLAEAAGLFPARLVHPSATFGSSSAVGDGMVVAAHVAVTTNCLFGRHVHLNLTTTVGHDCTFGDFVTVNPGANISGNVRLEENVTVGTGATILQGLTIGRGTFVGAGSVVTKDMPPGVTAVGMPARAMPRSGA